MRVIRRLKAFDAPVQPDGPEQESGCGIKRADVYIKRNEQRNRSQNGDIAQHFYFCDAIAFMIGKSGMPAARYSSFRLIPIAQKCGGCHKT